MKKKRLFLINALLAPLFVLFIATGCDKVEFPVIFKGDIDTNIYPGNFNTYEFPTFEENTNTLRNVLIEDYTGHKCPFCPNAAAKAEEIAAAHPDRVFVAAIHASPEADGRGEFQVVDDTYKRDFTNPQGLEMAINFFNLGIGFTSNPRGNVNRSPITEDGNYFTNQSFWEDKAVEILASGLDVNIQAKSNYFEETKGVFLHTETEFLNDISGNYNIVVYVIENEFIAPQTMPDNSTNSTYKHHDIHLGNLFNETWGRPVGNGEITAGTKVKTDFSYLIPDGLTKDDIHFLVSVINRDTYEVMQVIKHKI